MHTQLMRTGGSGAPCPPCALPHRAHTRTPAPPKPIATHTGSGAPFFPRYLAPGNGRVPTISIDIASNTPPLPPLMLLLLLPPPLCPSALLPRSLPPPSRANTRSSREPGQCDCSIGLERGS